MKVSARDRLAGRRACSTKRNLAAQEGNEAASLHPLDLVLEACAT